VADLIKEGADVKEQNRVSLHRALSASVCIDGYVNDSSHGTGILAYAYAELNVSFRDDICINTEMC
jgi:hypothetical protein